MKTRMTATTLTVTVFVAVLLSSAPVQSVPLSIQNPSFEDFVLADGGWMTEGGGLVGYGWNTDPEPYTTGSLWVGAFNPNAAQHPGGAPDGVNVAYSAGPTIYQTLGDVLTANTEYTLLVDIGYSIGASFMGYHVRLLAGGSLLAEDNNSEAVWAGSFSTSVVTYTALPGDPLLGQPLEIRLDIANPGEGNETNFDNVRLSAIPEPTTALLLATGLAGLAVAGRRRRSLQ